MIAAVFFSSLDWLILVCYFIGMLGLAVWFWRKNQSAEEFTAAGRSLSGWLCGLSIFATYLSSISYLALPGKAFVDNWNPFVFSLALPIAAVVAVKYFVPLYRKSGEVSAYSLLEKRFGLWARIYASCFYLIFQVARIGVVMYLMALPMAVIFEWDIRTLIVMTGAVVIFYSFLGGITAVIWADAIQAIVLLAGALLALAILWLGMSEGPSEVFDLAAKNEKFSLGSADLFAISQPTIWVVFAFGFFENIRNFGIDQSYIQRYIAAKDDREAANSVWLAAGLYVPVSALFLLIGTSLYAYYETHAEDLQEVRQIVARQQLMQAGVNEQAADYDEMFNQAVNGLETKELGDRVFPHFIAAHLPIGLRGLLIAAVFAAAMSTVSTSLNSSATLVMNDLYKRLWQPTASDRQQLWVLRAATVVWGVLGTGMALVLAQISSTILDLWWVISGALGAAIIGLFLMGQLVPRLRNAGAVWVLGLGLILIAWMTIEPKNWPESLAFLASPFHPYLVIVLGPILMIALGQLLTWRRDKDLESDV